MGIQNENTNRSEQQTPIFLLSLSFTDTQLNFDTNQLNLLSVSAKKASPDAERYLSNIHNEFKQAYDKITPLFEKLLMEIFGDSEIESETFSATSESTVFFIGGENDESEANEYFEESN